MGTHFCTAVKYKFSVKRPSHSIAVDYCKVQSSKNYPHCYSTSCHGMTKFGAAVAGALSLGSSPSTSSLLMHAFPRLSSGATVYAHNLIEDYPADLRGTVRELLRRTIFAFLTVISYQGYKFSAGFARACAGWSRRRHAAPRRGPPGAARGARKFGRFPFKILK